MDLTNLAEVQILLGNVNASVSTSREVLKIGEGNVDRHVSSSGRISLARALQALGSFHEAVSFLEPEFQEDPRCEKYTHFKIVDPRRLSRRTHYHSELLIELGDTDRARRICEPLFELSKIDPGSSNDEAFDALTAGWLAFNTQDHDVAEGKLVYALEKSRSSGRIQTLLKSLLFNANLNTHDAKYKASKACLDEATRIAKRCSMRLFECDAHLEYARLALAEGNPDAALPHFKSAASLVSACGYHRRDPEIAELKTALNSQLTKSW